MAKNNENSASNADLAGPESRGQGQKPGHGQDSPVHWADETAEKIIREKGAKDSYTCASGITPSGTVHIGNFREIISTDLVVRALRDRNKKVRFIYSWDDYDVFRKVPVNMPDREKLETYLRFPITMVPDPWGRDSSYARHHETDVETVLPLVGIHPEFLYQAERYQASRYAGGIRRALEHRETLKNILDKFRDEEHKIQGEWWPVGVFCDSCHKDDTEVEGWDGEWGLSYHCRSCGHQETVDLRSAKGVKLGWRVDWPMRWEYEKVDFEPAGKDHHSQGGSFDTARHVCKEVYGWNAPVTFRYDFIGIKGNPGKMSSSKGKVVDLPDLLRVYTPELVRYLFAGTRPNTEFTISFDLDVIKIYEDYDKTERIAWGDEHAKDEAAFLREKRIYEFSQVEPDANGKTCMPPVKPCQIPFRHLCNLIQIADGDIEKAITALGRGTGKGPSPEQIPGIRARAIRAKYWIDECAPEEFRFKLRAPDGTGNNAGGSVLSPEERAAIRRLRDTVVTHIETYADDKSCAEAIYQAAADCHLEGKALFRAAYQALIGKDQGPRLASFLRSIDKDRLLGILAEY
ncbi:MAG: lysine--tRNA ligase [Treponema sp.]|jgi:lysyl-tRNA synthetase class 1|nr:lysine--tRNA ligase [Treponema sp.]